MRRSAAMKKQVKAMQSMDERMARIEAALGITDEDPTPSPSPQEQGEEQDAGDRPSVKWDDLGSYTLAELREIAATHEIDITGLRTKDPVVESILAWVEDNDPTPSPSPQEQGGEQEAGDSVPNGDDVSDDAEPEADEE